MDETIRRIDKSFKKRCQAEIEEILKIAPFNDENKSGKRYWQRNNKIEEKK